MQVYGLRSFYNALGDTGAAHQIFTGLLKEFKKQKVKEIIFICNDDAIIIIGETDKKIMIGKYEQIPTGAKINMAEPFGLDHPMVEPVNRAKLAACEEEDFIEEY